jgi:type VI secretion system secreted protein Hcp
MSSNRALVFAPAALLALNAGMMEIHAAQVDYFLKLDGIVGESTFKGEEGTIQLESFSWGITNSSTIGSATGGAGAGKSTFNSIKFTKRLDATSPTLLLKCATGEHIKSGSLTIVTSSADHKLATETLIKLELEEIIISSLVENGSAAGVPTDSMSLNFSRLAVSRKAGGSTIEELPIETIDTTGLSDQ